MTPETIRKSAPTKTERAAAIPSERGRVLTASTVPADELSSPEGFWLLDPRARARRQYFVKSRRALRRLVSVAIELALIALLMAGFIMAALFALNLAGMLTW